MFELWRKIKILKQGIFNQRNLNVVGEFEITIFIRCKFDLNLKALVLKYSTYSKMNVQLIYFEIENYR